MTRRPPRFNKLNEDIVSDIMSRAIQRAKLLKHIRENLSYEATARDLGLSVTGVNRIINGVSHAHLTVERRAELGALVHNAEVSGLSTRPPGYRAD